MSTLTVSLVVRFSINMKYYILAVFTFSTSFLPWISPIRFNHYVFIRETWVLLPNELVGTLVAGSIVVVTALVMIIDNVHSTVGTLWATRHHPAQQLWGSSFVGDSVYAIHFFFSSSPSALVSFFWLGWADNRFAGKSIRNWTIYIYIYIYL